MRVKVANDKVISAEADSIYIKGYGDSAKITFDKLNARDGSIGIDSKIWDVVLKSVTNAKNLEFIVRSVNQIAGSLNVSNLLNIITDNGVSLTSESNKVAQISVVNNKSGDVLFMNNGDLTINKAVNKAEKGNLGFSNKGAVTAKEGFSSKGAALIWAEGDIDVQKDSDSKEWMGLYAENGGIKTKSLNVGSINLSASKNGLTAEDITSDDYIIADVKDGDISVGNLSAAKGETRLIT